MSVPYKYLGIFDGDIGDIDACPFNTLINVGRHHHLSPQKSHSGTMSSSPDYPNPKPKADLFHSERSEKGTEMTFT